MNDICHRVWSRARCTPQVALGNTQSHDIAASGGNASSLLRRHPLALACAAAIALGAFATPGFACTVGMQAVPVTGHVPPMACSEHGGGGGSTSASGPIAFWSTTPGAFGGTGTWTATSDTWTDSTGTAPLGTMNPNPGLAEFQGTPGTVTVSDADGPITVTAMHFSVDGYQLAGKTPGDSVTLVGTTSGGTTTAPVIDVGNGTTASASDTATIGAVLAGSAGLTKADYGTLLLTGANTWTGGTTISGGTLTIGNGTVNGALGAGTITDDGTLGFLPNASGISFGNTITGDATAMVHLFNSGTLTYKGQSTGPQWMLPGGGTLDVADGASITGGMASGGMGGMTMGASAISFMKPGGTVNVEQGATVTGGMGMSGMAGGAGVTGEGNDTLNVAGTIAGGMNMDGSHADAVAFSGGGNTLTLENGYLLIGNAVSTSGTGASAMKGGDTLALGGNTSPSGAFNLSDIVAAVPTSPQAGVAYYAGFNKFAKTGDGTWVVTGSNGAPFQGGVNVNGGTLQVGTASTRSTVLNANDYGAVNGNVTVNRGATLSGFGTVSAALTTIAAGATLRPGRPGDAAGDIGDLGIENGPLDMFGTLAIGIDGTNAFDSLFATDAVTFDNTSAFRFAFSPHFDAAAGDTFDFFSAFSFADLADATYGCSGLASGWTCSLSQLAAAPGDDGAQPSLELTLNGPGSVNAVPEPGDLGMFGLGIALLGGLFVFDRRRRMMRPSSVR